MSLQLVMWWKDEIPGEKSDNKRYQERYTLDGLVRLIRSKSKYLENSFVQLSLTLLPKDDLYYTILVDINDGSSYCGYTRHQTLYLFLIDNTDDLTEYTKEFQRLKLQLKKRLHGITVISDFRHT